MLSTDLPSAFAAFAEDKNHDAGSASGSESSTSEDVSSSGVPLVAGGGGGGSAHGLASSMGGGGGLGFAAAAGNPHISSSVGSEDGAFHGKFPFMKIVEFFGPKTFIWGS